jgi:GT2 family glycosyltransferase
MSCSVVIVAWKAPDLLAACLSSVARDPAVREVIVVDNAPGGGLAGLLRDLHPLVRLLEMETNQGFAGGCNRGLAAASGDPVLLLNPDVEARPGAIARLVEALARRPEAGAVGGLLVDRQGTPQPAYRPGVPPTPLSLLGDVLIPRLPARLRRPGQTPAAASHAAPREVERLAGACLMVRRRAFESLGGFDERFWPAWFEDVDLCVRMRRAAWVLLHQPAAVFLHHGGGSVRHLGATGFYTSWYGNLHRYTRKHHGPAVAAAVRAALVPGMAVRLAGTAFPGGAAPFGRGARAAAYARVLGWSLSGWPSTSPSTS